MGKDSKCIEEQIAYAREVASLEGDYSRRLAKGFVVWLFRCNRLTRWLYDIRIEEARIFADNADLIETAVNAIELFNKEFSSKSSKHKDPTQALCDFLERAECGREIPDIEDNYSYLLAVFYFVAKDIKEKNIQRHGYVADLTIADLENALSTLSEIKKSHLEATFWAPPKIIIISAPELRHELDEDELAI